MLILYFVRYLLSRCFRLLQGNFSHSKQYFASLVWKIMQFLILHLTTETALFMSSSLQPGHLFLSLRYAMQIPQFIPHGAINEVSFKDSMVLFPLFFRGITKQYDPIPEGLCFKKLQILFLPDILKQRFSTPQDSVLLTLLVFLLFTALGLRPQTLVRRRLRRGSI